MEIYIKNKFEGFHKWKDAPDEVAFLRDVHRHIFHVKTTIEVQQADRELEFFMVQHRINDIIAKFNNETMVEWSCETIGIHILKELHKLYPGRRMMCDVNEDGENGAVVRIDGSGLLM